MNAVSVNDFSNSANDASIANATWVNINAVESIEDFSLTPRLTDIAPTALDHLCIPIDPLWDFDGNSLVTADCNVDCIDPGLSISGLPASTSSASPIALDGYPSGGTFMGNGVIFNAFNPSLAGAGIHDITYTYEVADGCVFEISATVLVVNISYNFVTYNLGVISPE